MPEPTADGSLSMRLLHHPATAWVILLVSFVITGLAWMVSDSAVQKRARERFEFQVQDVGKAITKRMAEYQMVLRSGAGLFEASERVERSEWRTFVADLRLQEFFPGIQGLGFAEMFPPAQKARHEARVRAEGFPEYRVRPLGERAQYSAIVYLEPFDWRNQRAFGFDMFSEPVRREAMERARDSGEIAASGRVTLVQETQKDVQFGFLMYHPVYRSGLPTTSAEERRLALQGFVYSPFRIRDLMHGILGADQGDIDFELYDGSAPDAASLLYENTQKQNLAYGRLGKEQFSRSVELQIGGRTWTLFLFARPGYLSAAEENQPLIIAIGGFLIDLLLFFNIASIARQKNRIERRAQEISAELQASEARFRSLAANAQVGIFRADAAGRLLFANASWDDLSGHPAAGEGGEPGAMWWARLHPDDLGRAQQSWQDLATDGTPFLGEYRFLHPQGRCIWVMATAAREGESGNFVGTITDIQAQKTVVEAQVAAREAAEAANLAKSRFLATMSHEIRTPLNGILGMAQLMLASGQGNATHQEQVRIILRSGNVLLTLLNDILDLSRIESGRIELEDSDCDPAVLLADTSMLFEEMARQRGLDLLTRWHGPVGRYRMDVSRARQMLSNLIGNALKFTERGTIRIEGYQVTDDAGRRLLRFNVSDSGIGVPQENRGRLFEAFSQADSGTTRRYGGSGLGLSIVRQLARLMGGDAGFEPMAGQGSRFWFTLAARQVENAVPTEARERLLPLNDGGSAARFCGTALVVEDDPTNLKVCESFLSRLGVSVLLAQDGQEALTVFDASRPDLILMDVQMPVMDGLEATRQIRSREQAAGRARTPILAITADAFAEDRAAALESGMDDFLSKPLLMHELSEKLTRWMPPASAPPAASADSEAGIFSTEKLLAQLDGDLKLARIVVESGLRSLPGYGERLAQAAAKDDREGLQGVTHTLKTLLVQLGAPQVAERFQQCRNAIKQGRPPDAAELAALQECLRRLKSDLEVWLRENPGY